MQGRLLRNFPLGLIVAVVMALAISLFTATTATTSFYYTVTDLGTLGGDFSVARDINDKGQVVGTSRINTSSQVQHAFLWQNGAMTDLGSLDGNFNIAYGINNAGQVVGGSLGLGRGHALSWQNGAITYLDTIDDRWSVARAINNAGQVVGQLQLNTTYYQGSFLWQNGQMTSLGSSGQRNGALGINNAGQIVGFSSVFDGQNAFGSSHAFLWSNGTTTDLTPNNGRYASAASSINNTGAVVGTDGSSGFWHAALWQNGTKTDLSTLPGKDSSDAFDINDAGTVIGYSYIFAPNDPINQNQNPRAFVWRNGTMTDLNNLLPANSGWELTSAWGINNNGQIVGSGQFNGQQRAYLLTPVTVIN